MVELGIDIETIPGQAEWIKEEAREKVSPPGTYKKPESIEKWMEENAEQEADNIWRKTALDGSRGELLCFGFEIEGEQLSFYREIDGSEADLLQNIYDGLSKLGPKPLWIGHNITGFDLRFLWQRSVINGVKPSIEIPYDAKPWDARVYDTMYEWAGLNWQGRKSLDAVCKALGIEGKGDIDGSKVWDYAKEGKIKEISDYCKEDVKKAITIYKRMTFGGI